MREPCLCESCDVLRVCLVYAGSCREIDCGFRREILLHDERGRGVDACLTGRIDMEDAWVLRHLSLLSVEGDAIRVRWVKV
jgi:hypothetical protein